MIWRQKSVHRKRELHLLKNRAKTRQLLSRQVRPQRKKQDVRRQQRNSRQLVQIVVQAISSGYGYRGSEFHKGIDIPASAGTTIVAAGSGTVEWANYSTTAGNWIGINHGNGVYSVYMHMSALLVSAGTKVSAGQSIGLVGNTGASQGNHLHFAVRKNGAYVNPWDYLK